MDTLWDNVQTIEHDHDRDSSILFFFHLKFNKWKAKDVGQNCVWNERIKYLFSFRVLCKSIPIGKEESMALGDLSIFQFNNKNWWSSFMYWYILWSSPSYFGNLFYISTSHTKIQDFSLFLSKHAWICGYVWCVTKCITKFIQMRIPPSPKEKKTREEGKKKDTTT